MNTEEEDVKKILLQRLLLIARLPNGLGDRTELAAHYEKLSLQLSKQFKWDNMTGLLLLYPSCLIHVIESSRDVLVAILEDLIELQDTRLLLNADLDTSERTEELLKEPTETLVLQVLSSVKTIAKQHEQTKRAEGGRQCKILACLQMF
ncbi:hypothetical protein WMY93_010699 [Mugilogobius chulae]|uniref:Uncharacterized protein n=1 Tax=Mugilogobius chulae TaxID=88201 RepID=A0AAW0P8E7_9GOBI